MRELDNAISVDFPLRGEWIALHTPAHRIPSHRTNSLGQRFAYDFLRIDQRPGIHFFPGSYLEYWLMGVSTDRCYSWQEPVHAPFDADVLVTRDGLDERPRLHPFVDTMRILRNTLEANVAAHSKGADTINLQAYVGNYVILRRDTVYAFFGHLHAGSITVLPGQRVHEGDEIGKVGNTGNSTAPHLHFHLMDSHDLLSARGIPCAFKQYEVYANAAWTPATDSVPQFLQRIRYTR